MSDSAYRRLRLEADGAGLRIAVEQRRFEPLWRWFVFALAVGGGGAVFAGLLRVGLSPGWLTSLSMIGLGLALFVASLTVLAGFLMALPLALSRRGLVVFRIDPLGIEIARPARRGAPRTLHRDALAGPFVRIDEAIDEEASATTMMRMGGADMALALAEGARASGGSADTMTWFLFQSSAASVSVLHRGFTVVLAEGLRRDEAEELAHRVARVLERLPG